MRVTGVILDENSAPLGDAAVFAEVERRAGMAGRTFSMNDGSFTMDLPRPGEYILYAYKAPSGYPNPRSAFYAHAAKEPMRLVASQGMPKKVVLKLGPKCGMLQGSVVDAESGKTLTYVTFEMVWKSDPQRWTSMSLSAPFNIPVPPVPISIEIRASGYLSWIGPAEGLSVPMGKVHPFHLKLNPERHHP